MTDQNKPTPNGRKAGSTLSRLIAPDKTKDECPPLEEISALVDNALTLDKRELIMAHVTSCAACHELYVETIETLKDIEETHSETGSRVVSITDYPKEKRVKKFAFAVSTLAAAAILMLIWLSQAPTLPSSGMMIRQIAMQPRAWTETIEEIQYTEEQQLGAFEKPVEMAAFSVGTLLTQFEITRRGSNREMTKKVLKSLLIELAQLPPPEKTLAAHQTNLQHQRLESQTEKWDINQMEELIAQHPQQNMVRFGEWVMLGYLAADHENKFFFQEHVIKSQGLFRSTTITRWLEFGKEQGWPEQGGILKSLQEIKTISKNEQLNEDDFYTLKKAYQRILRHFK
jgi:hypothetical protein